MLKAYQNRNDAWSGVVSICCYLLESDIQGIADKRSRPERLILTLEILPDGEFTVLDEFLVHQGTLLEELVQFSLGNFLKHPVFRNGTP